MVYLVIPETHEGVRGAGQWKDLQGIRIVLNQLGVEWQEFRFDERNFNSLIVQIGDSNATVIWYYTFWPEAIETLKKRCQRVRIVLRTVNAEALQHWTRAQKDWRRLRGLPRDIYGFLRLLMRDQRCCRAADALAGISAWDDAYYWSRLSGRIKVQTAPYLCPWPRLLPDVKSLPWEKRDTSIICLAGTRDPIGRGHVAGFAALSLRPELSNWSFSLSDGLMDASRDDLPAGIERLGHLEEPWPLLCKVKAVAVLSPLGYGYKTTVADALAAGCHVLVHPHQHAHLLPEEQALTISIDPGAPDWLALSLRLSRLPATDSSTIQQAQQSRSLSRWKVVLDRLASPTFP